MKNYLFWGSAIVIGLASGYLYGAEAHPAVTAAGWAADPAAAAAKANELAKHTAGMGAASWTGLIALGMTALAGIRMLAPLIPGVGPVWKLAIDGLWNIAQHKDAKQADKAQANVAEAAALSCSLIRLTRQSSPEAWARVPETVRLSLEALEKVECGT